MEENKRMTTDLLKEITKLDIIDFEFELLKNMENIEEYAFSMVKLEATLKDKTKQDVYIKLIRKDRIKESIFCYWCILYDEKFKGYQESEFTTIINKVRIIETESQECKHTVSLNIKENKWGILEYGSDIHLVKFRKYLEEETKNPNVLKWKRYLTDDSSDVLFVATVKEDS